MRATNTFQALCLGAALGLTGCVSVHQDPDAGRYDRYDRYGDYGDDTDYGPPPHAPAHGYRHRYYGVEHVYNANVGVYTVVGYPDLWFHDGFYYRHRQGYWERCNRPRGGHWGRADWAYVPKRLHGRYPNHGRNDRWDDRHERKEERHERVDERRRDHDQRVEQRHDEHDARKLDRHERVDAQRDERRDQRDERKVEHKAERHERVAARHEQRAERRDDKREKKERGDDAGPVE